MCGIFGIASVAGNNISLSDTQIGRLRDMMAHRGPDGSGLWRRGNIVLAHRRLAVVDLSEAASQPMVTPDGRYAITYNGELYNDADIRSQLSMLGVRFRTGSDTETVMHAIAAWGVGALTLLRGMFAFAWVDVLKQQMILARDPLGIKPLFYWLDGGEGQGNAKQIVFASELPPILSHPDVPVRPSLAGISAYLTTIRTTLGSGTMFEGVCTVRPGQALVLDLSGRNAWRATDRCSERSVRGVTVSPLAPTVQSHSRWHENQAESVSEGTEQRVRATVQESVRLHLRSDVPACVLLSGGLDSSIIASCATHEYRDRRAPGAHPRTLKTYCSGAADQPSHGDFTYARMVASHLGTDHAEAPVTRELFRRRWPEMVHALGVPLSTPNEVAINHVARALRADGQIVALSGEGADELFAGYEQPMRQAWLFEAARLAGASKHDGIETQTRGAGGLHQLHANAWVPLHLKHALFNEQPWRALEDDAALREFYASEFDAVMQDGVEPSAIEAAYETDGTESLQPHLRFLRQINLSGLLARLDTATMLASVEGRTPFADRVVAELAESLPMHQKFGFDDEGAGLNARSGDQGFTTTLNGITHTTKRSLRAAFEADLPAEILARPKASFPLPFEQWVADHASRVRESSLARELFSPAAIELVVGDAAGNWRLAWPMLNVAMWGQRWWG